LSRKTLSSYVIVDANNGRKPLTTENRRMLATTIEVIRAGLKSDPTISPSQRSGLIALLRHGPKPSKSEMPEVNGPQVITRKMTAERLNRSLRFVDRLAKEGILRKVKLPGRQRAIGFAQEDVARLISEVSLDRDVEMP
jgi:hypothetical protein